MRIEGYAALFGLPDQMGDVVRAGAFAASLERRAAPLPMLVEHDQRLVAGVWSACAEDARGLFVCGSIDDRLRGAGRAKGLIARGVDGLSIGFLPVVARRTARGRVLEEIELLEVSVVTHPMQPQARLNLAREFGRAIA